MKPFLEDPWSSQNVGYKEKQVITGPQKNKLVRLMWWGRGRPGFCFQVLVSYRLRTGFVYLYELVGSQFRISTGQFRIKRVVDCTEMNYILMVIFISFNINGKQPVFQKNTVNGKY